MRRAGQGFETDVRIGRPLQAIADAAREWQPRLIVMAAPQRRTLDALVGTTAERAVRATSCPVLAVQRPGEGPYKRILVATDLGESFESLARAVADMGVLENADAWVVHAFDPPYYGAVVTNANERAAIAASSRRLKDGIASEVTRELERIGVSPKRVRISALPGQPIDAIETVAQYVKPDLVVVGANPSPILRRLIAGSVVHEVFRRAECDILAIPTATARKNWLRAA